MHRCDICREEFEKRSDLTDHWDNHLVKPVSDEPLVRILTLPDGITPGRFEAAEKFAEAIKELRAVYPGVQFQFIPFNYSPSRDGPALESILAVAEPSRKAMVSEPSYG
ncbi:MAG: hypothetical protein AAB892_01095 [Patescibacteria group bacterium]